MDNNSKLEHKSESERRGPFLLTLCILSFVGMGYTMLVTLLTYFGGVQQLEEQLEQSTESVKNDLFNLLDEDMIASIDEMTRQTIEHFIEIQFTTVIALIVGILSVIMMFQLKKNGFYLYVLYTFLAPAISLCFLGTNSVILGAVFINLFFGLVFCILYAANLKRMTN